MTVWSQIFAVFGPEEQRKRGESRLALRDYCHVSSSVAVAEMSIYQDIGDYTMHCVFDRECNSYPNSDVCLVTSMLIYLREYAL